ncbi:ATPase domain-containing protein [Pseudomonas saliphila]|uniref:ATPase domain-containing protein n=1 Tax=Pseudomonas saliphila TaxID=2586906 RepID=UPI00123BB851|nr:ATPase domain-containing protein [Pseudomonas saliphila]
MSESAPRKPLRPRLSTGVNGLDTVLLGGLIPAAVYIVQGSPGAGKTILANQVCFHRADLGEHSLYVTLLAESHDRMVEHLSTMSYFDAKQVPESVYYISAYSVLEQEGLEGILRLLTHERKTRGASLIVLDGLFVLEETVHTEAEFRKFVNNLSAFANLSGCTMLLLTNSARGPHSPEYTMVDGWIELGRQQMDYHSHRFFQVHKFRGSGFISGNHMTNISDEGIRVFPRLESSLGRVRGAATEKTTVSTGIASLDQMMGGGIRGGSTTLFVGPSGIGKTTLGLQFIAQSTPEEPGLIFSFYEGKDDLVDKAQSLGIDLEALIRDGTVEAIWQPATENTLDELGYELLEAVQRRGVKRLFLDGINAFQQSAEYPDRIRRFLAALTNVLHSEGVTVASSLVTEELMGVENRVQLGSISAAVQNILLLRYVEINSSTRRSISVVKVRSSAFDPAIREYFITDEGVVIGEQFQQADTTQTEHGHPRRIQGDS